ncbi:chromate resistance protein ChrB domain-containing protein [Streptomyces sp. NPDC058623]|uniref:chromate resistance protein ChrB domain-containing protein n=1 Tax=Streptomyces sp. NPDC058623 TaxID=3346563 RepID=UPI00364FCFB7
MKWATRAGIHIDRAACAWLIGRFIDSEAEFVFVSDPAHVPADATPFDMRGAELGHHHGDCSFETILRVHRLTDDPALQRIAQIVHEADIDDERFHAPEAPGLDVVLRGLSMTGDDSHTMAIANPVFDGLYEYYQRAAALGREPA